MILRKARETDVDAIRQLWMCSFGDDAQYVDFYLLHKAKDAHVILLTERDEVVGMIHLLPCGLYPDQKAFYWYAAAIREDLRGRGYFRFFVQTLLEKTKAAGYANLCVPADGLTSVYQKFGFSYAYRALDVCVKRDGKREQEIEISDACASDFLSLFRYPSDQMWDPKAIDYALLENSLCGGKNLLITRGNERFSAMLRKTSKGYRLDETTISLSQLQGMKNQLLSWLCVDELILREYRSEGEIVGLADVPLHSDQARVAFTMP